MKLKFKAHQLVDLPIGTVSEKIVGYVKEKDYSVIKQTATAILFDDQITSWKLVSNSIYYIKMDEGRFDLIQQNDQTVVRLTYSLSVTFELIQLLLIIFASVYIGYEVLFLAVVLILNFIFKVLNIRNHLIGNIFNTE